MRKPKWAYLPPLPSECVPLAPPMQGTERKPKWGYVTHQVGAELLLRINTTRSQVGPGSRPIEIMLAYLKSYHHMGTAVAK